MKLPVWKPLCSLLRILGFPTIWEVSVGAVVFRNENGGRTYLTLKYPSGHLDFAKGHMETGETEEETLRRETEEETGIADLRVFPLRSGIRYFYVAKGSEYERRKREGRGTWIFKVVYFYPAETRTTDVRISHEHTGFEWLPYEEALSGLTFENARMVLSRSEMFLRKKEGI